MLAKADSSLSKRIFNITVCLITVTHMYSLLHYNDTTKLLFVLIGAVEEEKKTSFETFRFFFDLLLLCDVLWVVQVF